MALVVNTNVASIQAQYNVSKTNGDMQEAMARISSGSKVNSASDDAAGLSIASRMEAQIRGLATAMRNANDGIGLVQTAEGAMNEITEMLQRMRELAIQGANGVNTDVDRANLNEEVTQLKSEIDRIVNTTTFNDQKLLDGSWESSLQIGYKANETLGLALENLSTAALGSLTGAPATGAVTSANAKGVEATATVAQLTFNGNDSYKFDLALQTASGTTTFTISADVQNNSAQAIVDKINSEMNALAGGTATGNDAASSVRVTYSGNVVTLTNNYGGSIAVSKNASNPYSTSGSTIGYTTVTGGNNSDNLILGSSNSFAGTLLQNNNAFVAASEASVTLTEAATLTSGDFYSIKLDATGDANDLTITTQGVTGTTAGDGVTAILNAFNSLSDRKGYSLSVSGAELTITRADGVDFDVVEVTTGAADLFAGATAVAGAGVVQASGTEASGDASSNMYLEFTGPDTYTLQFTGNGASETTGTFDIVYDGTEASLNAAASVIGTKINAAFGSDQDVSVTVEGGRIKISDSKGQEFKVSDFASVGSGTIMASVDAGQGSSNDGILLDDTSFSASATSVAAGTATASAAVLTFSADDRYSFNISDGDRTAVVAEFAGDISTTATTALIAAEINAALQNAGMQTTVKATASATTAGEVTITQANGKQLDLTNFLSDSTGTVKFEAGTSSTGFTKFLDDGDSTGEVISNVSILTVAKANESVAIIDRAIEDITGERAKLGAVANRLDHTVSNLGNIQVNTEASRSAIMDADFAAESAKLAKNQILLQAGTAMLAQANASQQTVLSLLG